MVEAAKLARRGPYASVIKRRCSVEGGVSAWMTGRITSQYVVAVVEVECDGGESARPPSDMGWSRRRRKRKESRGDGEVDREE
jgi:hypothetical protein